MALWITNSLLRTKSFQIHSNLPPLLSLPTTTIRTVFSVEPIDPSNTPATDKPSSSSSSSLKPATTPTPKFPKHHQKSKLVRLIKNTRNKVMALAPFKKVKEYSSPLRNHNVVDKIDPRFLFQSVFQSLKSSPPIIFTGEARKLEERLGEAAMGNAFLLQGGDCDEFNANNNNPDTFRVILQMSTVLMFGGQMPVIKVGNQFGKPRSDIFEEKDGMKLDNLNGDAFALESSTLHQQKWIIKAYNQSAYTLNLLRAFAMGGDAAMQRVTQWNLDFTKNSEHGDRYRELASQVDEALGFMSVAYPTVDHPTMTITDFWTSHECRHLPYEQSLTRKDSTSGLNYDCSAHFLWVGELTCQLDGAHLKFLRQIANPLGIKVSEKMDPKELVKIIGILNPENKPGRITIITRMGAENIKMKLPNIIREVQRVGQIVTWVTDPDPMPRNTFKAPSSLKTHAFDAIRAEVKAFFDVHEQEGSYPGGVHLEMTGQNETGCNGGSRTAPFDHTHCDPRLNASQSLELAFIIADRLRKRRIATRSTKL